MRAAENSGNEKNRSLWNGIRHANGIQLNDRNRRREIGAIMDQKWNFEVGDVVKLKKPHPCGSHEWEILRVGADFRLKCMGCGHQVMTERKMVEKNARGLTKAVDQEKE